MEFEFELSPKPEIVSPDPFVRRIARIRSEVDVVVKYAMQVLNRGVDSLEARTEAIEAGRLIQVMIKNVQEFYKPIKQEIDALKEPILDAERQDNLALKSSKDLLASQIQEFERSQAEAEQAKLKAAQETAVQSGELPAPVMVQKSIGKTKGKVDRVTWKAEVTDLLQLVKAVAEGKVPLQAIEANQSFLDKRADADREGFAMPGVSAKRTEKVHFRA